MKKLSLITLSLGLILSSIPMAASAKEAATIKLNIDRQAVSFPDAQPYNSGDNVWIPLRPAAQALGLKISFDKQTQTIQLTKPSSAEVTFKLGSNRAVISKNMTISFGAAAMAKQNRVYVPLTFFTKVLGLESAFYPNNAEAAITSPEGQDQIVSSIVNQFVTGKYQQISDSYFDDHIKPMIPVEALQAGWEQISAAAGKYIGIVSLQQNPAVTDYKEFHALLQFSTTNAVLTVSLNDSNKVIGILINLVQPVEALPADLVEEEIVVGAGTDFPLPGTLTLPKDASGPVPAVVLVQGSGPSDRDETAGGYKPFRDIAWGLAQQGIAVIRYDKRTFVHGKSYTPDMLAKFTVKEETVDNAIAAAKLLKADKRIDSSRVYVAGHSLGGMLAPRIDAEGGDFAGLVILAGTTRALWEISADQNAAFIQAMDDKDPAKKANEAWLAAEIVKAQNIRNLSDSEASAQVVFGIPAYYFKEMDSHGAADLVGKITKPILILQGEDDFQVYADKDYKLWQEQLKGKPNASFKLYPGLNHFFVDYDGEGKNTIDEYNFPGKVEPQVIQDIANWINKK